VSVGVQKNSFLSRSEIILRKTIILIQSVSSQGCILSNHKYRFSKWQHTFCYFLYNILIIDVDTQTQDQKPFA